MSVTCPDIHGLTACGLDIVIMNIELVSGPDNPCVQKVIIFSCPKTSADIMTINMVKFDILRAVGSTIGSGMIGIHSRISSVVNFDTVLNCRVAGSG